MRRHDSLPSHPDSRCDQNFYHLSTRKRSKKFHLSIKTNQEANIITKIQWWTLINFYQLNSFKTRFKWMNIVCKQKVWFRIDYFSRVPKKNLTSLRCIILWLKPMELFRLEFSRPANNWNQKRLMTSLVKLHGEPSEVSDIEQNTNALAKKRKVPTRKRKESRWRLFGSNYQAASW